MFSFKKLLGVLGYVKEQSRPPEAMERTFLDVIFGLTLPGSFFLFRSSSKRVPLARDEAGIKAWLGRPASSYLFSFMVRGRVASGNQAIYLLLLFVWHPNLFLL